MRNPRIFISYRRDTDGPYAGRLYESLARRIGEDNLVIDRENIEDQLGYDFGKEISATMRRCRVLLVVMGPGWAGVTGADGRPRLHNEHDWVRTEVLTGLARQDMLVVPVLVNGALVPRPDELPAPIRELAYRNAATVDDDRWTDDVNRLVRHLRVAARRRSPRAGHPATFIAVAAAVSLPAAVVAQDAVGWHDRIPQHATFWGLTMALLAAAAWSSAAPESRAHATLIGFAGGAIAGAAGALLYTELKTQAIGLSLADKYALGAALTGVLVSVALLPRVMTVGRVAAGVLGGATCAVAALLCGHIHNHTYGTALGATFMIMAVATIGSVAIASRWEPQRAGTVAGADTAVPPVEPAA